MEVVSHDLPRRNSGVVEAPCYFNAPGDSIIAEMDSGAAQKKEISERVREFGNPAAPGHHDDLRHCDLAAKEDKLPGVLYAADEWIEPDMGGNVKQCDNMHFNDHQKHVDKWRGWGGAQNDSTQTTALFEELASSKHGRRAGDGTFRQAITTLSEDGTNHQSSASYRSLSGINGSEAVLRDVGGKFCGPIPIQAFRGTTFKTDEYVGDELRVGSMPYGRIYFGENLKLSTALKKKLRLREDIESKKCAILASEAGSEWAPRGRPGSPPSRRRIDVLAIGIRLREITGGGAREQAAGFNTNVGRAINSIGRDVLTSEHEGGYQASALFLLNTIWKYLACEVADAETQQKGDSSSHTYAVWPTSNESTIFFISHHGHMMWAKPTSSTSSDNWGDWRGPRATSRWKYVFWR